MKVQVRGRPGAVRLSQELGAGGEARVYALPGHPDRVAKIYHRPDPAKAAKLEAMLRNPPEEPDPERPAVIWPVALVDRAGSKRQEFRGFTMPRVDGMASIFEVLNPSVRRQNTPLFGWRSLVQAARNTAVVMARVHAIGHVIGDLNESNVLVDATARIAIVDTDSFQVRDRVTGQLHRCPVGKPEYTAPELQGVAFRDVDQTPVHDHFALAVLIFQLLMEGTHPFAGVYQGRGEPPTMAARIAAGMLPGRSDARLSWMPAMPPIGLLGSMLTGLFERCFQRGHGTPSLRPTAAEWVDALTAFEKDLIACTENPQHAYGLHVDGCPWCARRDALGGRDPFPSLADVRRQSHLAPPPPRKPTELPRWRAVERDGALEGAGGVAVPFRKRRGPPRRRRAAARAARSPTQRGTGAPAVGRTAFAPGRALLAGGLVLGLVIALFVLIGRVADNLESSPTPNPVNNPVKPANQQKPPPPPEAPLPGTQETVK
ncbi:MAG: DNA-binding helix-hairpin-helix protein with protein kinase domain [Myxococcota bacterium]|jgi:DNA-binding helix-hairpin-helix protein with protein kinase domain